MKLQNQAGIMLLRKTQSRLELREQSVTVTSREIIDYLFNATNIRTFEARNNYKMEISKRS